MNDKTRKTVPLVGALALTASALLAGSGAALAAKADPTASLDKSASQCTSTYVRASFDLDANKGRWVHLSGELRIPGKPAVPLEWGKYDKNLGVELSLHGKDLSSSAVAHLELGDRKGATVFPDPFVVCPKT